MTNITIVKDLSQEPRDEIYEELSQTLSTLMIQQEIAGIRLATEWYGRGLPKDKVATQVSAVLRGAYSGETLEKYFQVLDAENDSN